MYTLVLTTHFLFAQSGVQIKLRARKVGRLERNLSTPAEAHLGPCQTSMIEIQPLTIFAKSSITVVLKDPNYASGCVETVICSVCLHVTNHF